MIREDRCGTYLTYLSPRMLISCGKNTWDLCCGYFEMYTTFLLYSPSLAMYFKEKPYSSCSMGTLAITASPHLAGGPRSTLCSLEFMVLDSTLDLSFCPWLFHLAQCSPVSSVLWQMLTFLSFLKLNSILLCRCTMLSLSIHLIATEANYQAWLLWTVQISLTYCFHVFWVNT